MKLDDKKKYYGKNLTDDQNKALELLDKFYNDKSKLFFVLSGAAGTGKTYIINNYLRYINRKPVAIAAPTHKAVRVIERATNKKGFTLQHLHGLRPNFNLVSFDIDKVKFDTIGEDKFRYYQSIINDEASMVSSNLFDLNSMRSKNYMTKIIYVGDPYQLPPVGDSGQSVVFDINDGFELTEIVRQESTNPLLRLLRLLREDVKSETSNFLNELYYKKEDVREGVGYESHDVKGFVSKIREVFLSGQLEKSINYARVLCWTNMAVLNWNKLIRNALLENPDRVLHRDDLLTGYTTVVDEFYSPIIRNSDDYNVLNLQERVAENGYTVFNTTLQSVDDYRQSTVAIVDHKSDDWINYYNTLSKLHEDAIYAEARDRKKKFKEYYNFKDRNLSMIKFPLVDDIDRLYLFIKRTKEKNQYLQSLSDSEVMMLYNERDNIRAWVDKDLDYGFALTVHKSQGSTYNKVFVNALDIAYYNGNKNSPVQNTNRRPHAKELRNKLLYTAMTRASESAIILI